MVCESVAGAEYYGIMRDQDRGQDVGKWGRGQTICPRSALVNTLHFSRLITSLLRDALSLSHSTYRRADSSMQALIWSWHGDTARTA